MSYDRTTHDNISLKEATVSNMCDVAAIGSLQDGKKHTAEQKIREQACSRKRPGSERGRAFALSSFDV